MQPGRTLCSRWLRNAFSLERSTATSELPVYLCPAFGRWNPSPVHRRRRGIQNGQHLQIRRLHVQADARTKTTSIPTGNQPVKTLPLQCSGCGALTQTTVPDQAGYFDMGRKAVREYLGLVEYEERVRKDVQFVQDALRAVDLEQMEKLGVNLKPLLAERPTSRPESTTAVVKAPLCDRCHRLVHHSSGNPIFHPTIDSLRATIEESPYKYNHVYHVLDAADFPMSLLPRIHHILDVMPLRSQNRRSESGKYHAGRKTEMSFIITRSDLLAPKKEQVDSLMPYLRETLREALGRVGRNVRLGNVRCISAKRNWWTKELKEEIWERGGAGWMVGKVNVGKSQLFEAVFPKGRMDATTPTKHQINVPVFPKPQQCPTPEGTKAEEEDPFSAFLPKLDPKSKEADETSLLPPARPETPYPEMPLVSSLPGTTASPIRVPFGNGKGELIDLPGLSRGDLELHVQEMKRPTLIMKSRVLPEQQTLKPWKSLLLGGFIRITPKTPDLIFLSCNFTPLDAHLTTTEKAVLIQEQNPEAPKIENISLPGTGEKIKHAGTFKLKYDITKDRTGPLTRKNAVNLKVDRLPYRVLGVDILIEGCGWVEVVAQVRTRQLFGPKQQQQEQQEEEEEDEWNPERVEKLDLSTPEPKEVEGVKEVEEEEEPNWPEIDVFSPDGKFIGSRRPMNAWLLNKPKTSHIKSRPRRSMKGFKKNEKRSRRGGDESSF
ncbi:hypothetical protein QBC46DRAFT_275976 [Diplogelasinospora grovesii]|uniref:Genetic interactor of prohibitins 3, mitochondrial n=1 Tax=Diplogelasinospora grovesii TaxID=303347 RepID=A0AAN6NI37_9PEZI|nr:hypothetical protein QBC46DRAFT_275976 [Diplogelasinospora grovesii]